jgi:hypothetical protein
VVAVVIMLGDTVIRTIKIAAAPILPVSIAAVQSQEVALLLEAESTIAAADAVGNK